jgi:hypothetical protein
MPQLVIALSPGTLPWQIPFWRKLFNKTQGLECITLYPVLQPILTVIGTHAQLLIYINLYIYKEHGVKSIVYGLTITNQQWNLQLYLYLELYLWQQPWMQEGNAARMWQSSKRFQIGSHQCVQCLHWYQVVCAGSRGVLRCIQTCSEMPELHGSPGLSANLIQHR